MADNQSSLDIPRPSLLPVIGQALAVVVTVAVVVALLACWLLYRFITWPSRSERPAGYDRGARFGATIALATAITALVKATRRTGNAPLGRA